MHIDRMYEDLGQQMIPGKVLLVFGPRQTGKTTLVTRYFNSFGGSKLFLNGDDIVVRELLSSQNRELILQRAEGYELLIIDEAQRIPGVGYALKLLADSRPGLKVIATGSSSFGLLGQVGEPLTGRKASLALYPIWTGELVKYHNRAELASLLPGHLVYGMYPEVLVADSLQRKRDIIMEIANSYLLKDILELEKVKASGPVLNLLRLVAFQVGSEVSLNELGLKTGLNYKTVSRYLDLFEKSYIIIRLGGFSRNLRNEINSKAKYYFYDNGIRNALIANFNPLDLRNDLGALWENHIVMERIKKRAYQKIYANQYFWRTWTQQEIDLIEEREGKLFAYEIKWQERKTGFPKAFCEAYPDSVRQMINRGNYLDFIL
jgi:predicted AAA+ superfamily ATPase